MNRTSVKSAALKVLGTSAGILLVAAVLGIQVTTLAAAIFGATLALAFT